MSLKQLIDKILPLTDWDRQCIRRVAAKEKLREQAVHAISDWHNATVGATVSIPEGVDLSGVVWERMDDGSLIAIIPPK